MSYEEQRNQFLRDRYKMPNGKLILDSKPNKSAGEINVADYVEEVERIKQKDFKLAFGSTTYNGEKMRIWFEVYRLPCGGRDWLNVNAMH
jgi:hypothetical protein